MDIKVAKENISRKDGWFLKNHPSFYAYIKEKYPNLTWRENLYLYINDFNNPPKCYCGNNTKFININKGFRTYCSTKCQANDKDIRDKSKSTCIEKYGSENPMQNDSIKKRLNESIMNKYGVDNISKLDYIKDKKAKTQLENYGYEYNSQRPEIKKRISDNMRDINLSLKDKRNINLSQYWLTKLEKVGINFLYRKNGSILVIRCSEGHDYEIKNGYLNDRMKWNNNICTICNPILKIQKIVFDNDSFLQRAIHIHQHEYEYLSEYKKSNQKIDILCKKCLNIFKQSPSSHLNGSRCPYCYGSISIKESKWLDSMNIPNNHRQTIIKIDDRKYNVDAYDPVTNTIYEFYGNYWHGNPKIYKPSEINKTIGKRFGELYTNTLIREGIFTDYGYKVVSIWEDEFNIEKDIQNNVEFNSLVNFIRSIYSENIVENYNQHFNIYLPDKNLIISFNKLNYELNRNYLKDKYLFFKKEGIRVINILEDDWIYKKSIICSQIRYLLENVYIKSIYARKCYIKEITQKESKYFLDNNHLQGYVSSVYSIGLFYINEMVSVMSFDKSEGRRRMNENEWNLNRFSSKIDTSVIGGFSKLLNYFLKNINPNRIISYADLSWSSGDIYFKNNFKLINMIPPDYKWVVLNRKYNKQKFKKSNLIGMGYDINKSESEIMTENFDSFKIWDCGKLKFEIKFS